MILRFSEYYLKPLLLKEMAWAVPGCSCHAICPKDNIEDLRSIVRMLFHCPSHLCPLGYLCTAESENWCLRSFDCCTWYVLFVEAVFVKCIPLPLTVQVLWQCIFKLDMLRYQIYLLKEALLPLFFFMADYLNLNTTADFLERMSFSEQSWLCFWLLVPAMVSWHINMVGNMWL